MNLRLCLVASALAFAGNSAYAACTAGIFNLGDITASAPEIGRIFNTQCGSFTDTYSFSVSDVFLGGAAVTINVGTFKNIVGFGGILSGPSIAAHSVDLISGFTEFLSAGSYTLSVSGNVTGTTGGRYLGALDAVAVPEPAGVLAALASLATIAALARRWRRQSSDPRLPLGAQTA